MAELYPFSALTADRLKAMPGAGKTHLWLPQVATGLRNCLSQEKCFKFLRQCCDLYVSHRVVPDREIQAAVDYAYGDHDVSPVNYGFKPLDWPEPSEEVIQKVLTTVEPCFDGVTSTGLKPLDVLPKLFRPGELVCTGACSEKAVVRPLEAVTDGEWLQFIVLNPMKGLNALNHSGNLSVRCQNNIRFRRYLVAEFDDARMTKAHQAKLVTALAQIAPLVMVVDSGGKSLHGWFRVEELRRQQQAMFFAVACLLGADRTRWDVCGWLRMPGGLRPKDGTKPVRQRILYFKGES